MVVVKIECYACKLPTIVPDIEMCSIKVSNYDNNNDDLLFLQSLIFSASLPLVTFQVDEGGSSIIKTKTSVGELIQ